MDTSRIPGFRGFDQVIEGILKEWKIPGLGLAIIRDGQVVAMGGYGLRDIERGLPVTENTLFAIGSSSKAFAAMCLGMLADEGNFDWDRPIKEYIPGFKMYDPVTTGHVTPRDICCHRTGLPRHTFFVMDSLEDRKYMVDRLRYLEPNKDFRSTWQYQNHMFGLAGYLAEVAGGATWEAMTRERIFKPLRMETSNFGPSKAETYPDCARPYREKEGVFERLRARELFAECPAGGIYSCPKELANWVRLHLAKGEFEGKRLVSEAQIKEMHGRQMLVPDTAETAFLRKYPELGPGSYGLGWFTETYRGYTLVHHGGGIDGFSTMVSMLPEKQLGVIAITNSGGALPMFLHYNVYERLLGLELTDWATRGREILDMMEKQQKEAKASSDARRKQGTQPSHPLDEYVGDYEHPGYGVMSIRKEGDGLTGKHHEASFALKHYHYDTFEFEYPVFGAAFKLAFHTDYDGNIASLTVPFEPSVKDIVYTRVAEKALKEKSFLEKFVGEYELMGMILKVTLKGDALIASVPGQGDQELVPYKGNEFRLKAVSGVSVEFKTGPDGSVTEAVLHQPGGSLTAKRKG